MLHAVSLSLSLLLLLPSFSSPFPSPVTSAMNAYEVLRLNGLPIGLLPKGVTEFQLDRDGRFEAHLDHPCTAQLENKLRYDTNVSGTISAGQITAVSGISAQELFLWFPVMAIRVDIPSSGLIYFEVGVIHKQFSLSLFDTPPDCSPVEDNSPPYSEMKSEMLRYDLVSEDAQRVVL